MLQALKSTAHKSKP